METRLKALSPKIGVVLFQLPPQSFALRHSSPDLIANAQLAVARNMLTEPESLPRSSAVRIIVVSTTHELIIELPDFRTAYNHCRG